MARRTGRAKPMTAKAGVTHEIGFKELSWSEKELDEFVKKCSKKHSLA